MAKRFDVLHIRNYEVNGEERAHFTKIGAAFENRDGSLNVLLEMMPASVDGQFKLHIREPLPPKDAPDAGKPESKPENKRRR